MMQLLMMSITGSVMILVIALLRVLLQNKLHRSVILALWFLAVLRLTVPLFPQSSASVYNILPRQAPAAVTVPQGVIVMPSSGAPVVYAEASALSWQELLRVVWLLGCVACLLFFAVVHIRARLRYRFAIPEEAPSYLGKLKLRRLEGLSSPLVYGLLHPTVLLPSEFPQKDSAEYEHVLRHEMRHVRNGDLWYKLLLLLVTSLHWCNPCVWLMLYLASQDMEMRCDAQVVKELGTKRAYAQTLVQAQVGQLNHLVQTCFAFCATARRIRALSCAKTHLLRSLLVCVLMAALLLTCFATSRNASASETEEEIPATTQATAPSSAVPTYPSESTTKQTQATEESSTIAETEPTTESRTAPETELVTEPTTEEQPSEATPTTQANVSTEAATQSNVRAASFAIGNYEMLATQTRRFTLYADFRYNFTTDRPDCIDIQVRSSDLDKCQLTVRAYDTGTANIYATDFSGTYWVGSITVLPSGETDELTFADMNGETPTISIPEVSIPIP